MYNNSTAMGINIKVATNYEQVTEAVEKFTTGENYKNRFLGVDCEWDAVTRRGMPQIPDLLQIANADGYCVLVRLNVLRCVPQPLKNLLENRKLWKLGVGIVEDAQKLKQGFGVQTQGVLDIRFLAKELKIKPKGMSFLSETVLGVKKPKYNYHFCWTKPYLSEKIQMYAATDAVNAARIFEKLNHRRLGQKWGNEWAQWEEEKYIRETANLWKRFVGNMFVYREQFNDIK